MDKNKVFEIRCKKCNKLMMEYYSCGNDSIIALQNIGIKCDRCKRVKIDDDVFSYRVGGVLIHDNKILLQKPKNDEPRLILLDKDGYEELQPITNEETFETGVPTEREYMDICNEFRWVSLYVTKGLCRDEFYYARYHYESIAEEFLKMLNLKIAADHDFKSVTGNHYKYLKRYLSEEEMIRVQRVFPSGEYDDMWEKLFDLCDYFEEIAENLGKKMGYGYDVEEGKRVREFIRVRYEDHRK